MPRPRPHLVLVVALMAAVAAAPACSKRAAPLPPPHTSPSGLVLEELLLGEGAAATTGAYVAVHYTAAVRGEPAYDSTLGTSAATPPDARRAQPGSPFVFKLGTTRVIDGLAEGILGMKSGGRRRLEIPPQLGYGAIGKGVIAPDATLIYEVELVEVFTRCASGIQFRVLQPGKGAPPKTGDELELRVRVFLLETGRDLARMGTRDSPWLLLQGHGDALPGLEEALAQMPVGATWLLALPPELAYGPTGQIPLLPPRTDVMVEVELLRSRAH